MCNVDTNRESNVHARSIQSEAPKLFVPRCMSEGRLISEASRYRAGRLICIGEIELGEAGDPRQPTTRFRLLLL